MEIRVDRRNYLAHRLAWLYVHGCWPSAFIDHINLIPGDNRIVNLREATSGQNRANSRVGANSLSGIKGVTFIAKHNRWRATITAGGRKFYLGTYLAREDAAAAYAQAAAQHHGEFARVA
jgi:hypothetical protein